MDIIATAKQDNDAVILGKRCVLNLEELSEALVDKDVLQVELKKSFTDMFFTPSHLNEYVVSAKKLRPDITFIVEDEVRVNAINRVRDLASIHTLEELIYTFESNPKEMFELVHMLCAQYVSAYSETLVANNKLASLHLQNSQLNSEKRVLEEELRNIRHEKNVYETKLKTLIARINYNYQKNLSEDALLSCDVCGYDKVLYIKEVTRVKYVDTFIYYLQEILRTLYSVPARIIIVEAPFATAKESLYPLCKSADQLSYNDVYKEDIFMAGFQPNLMHSILENGSNANYLIILDRSGYEAPYVTGAKIEYLLTVSDLKDLKGSNTPLKRIISYSTETLFIPNVPDFDSLSIEERMSKYSSMGIMKSVIDLLERRV